MEVRAGVVSIIASIKKGVELAFFAPVLWCNCFEMSYLVISAFSVVSARMTHVATFAEVLTT